MHWIVKLTLNGNQENQAQKYFLRMVLRLWIRAHGHPEAALSVGIIQTQTIAFQWDVPAYPTCVAKSHVAPKQLELD